MAKNNPAISIATTEVKSARSKHLFCRSERLLIFCLSPWTILRIKLLSRIKTFIRTAKTLFNMLSHFSLSPLFCSCFANVDAIVSEVTKSPLLCGCISLLRSKILLLLGREPDETSMHIITAAIKSSTSETSFKKSLSLSQVTLKMLKWIISIKKCDI